METNESERAIDSEDEDIEGLDDAGGSWDDYPLDDLLIRSESRTIYDVTRRIDQGNYVMDPDFQRDFIWPEDKPRQSTPHDTPPALLVVREGGRSSIRRVCRSKDHSTVRR